MGLRVAAVRWGVELSVPTPVAPIQFRAAPPDAGIRTPITVRRILDRF